MKTRVLFVINQFFKGGAETALLNLLKSLLPERYEVDFVIFDDIELKDAVTLTGEIPSWINVFNPGKKERKLAFFKKAFYRFWRKLTHGKQLYRRSVYRFVRNKRYDVAISFGEWFSCSLVAQYVTARRKYVWIHADMDKASFLYPDLLTLYPYFDRYLFVSEQSMTAAVEKYSFLSGKAVVVHNLTDAMSIRKQSEEAISLEIHREGLPLLVTVANLRPEKNHLRQIRVMKLLFDRGLRFYWLNVGSLANITQVHLVRDAIAEAGLEEYFLLADAEENPYPVMKQADAVCVLSDHESWSMVITEAMTLGTPVIATRTSGALEQLEHNETGLLCDFSDEDIANQIERFLRLPELAEHIRRRLGEIAEAPTDLHCIQSLLSTERKKVLYIFDNINYPSGARNAALAQMDCLSEAADVEAFSAEPCEDSQLSERWRIWDLHDNMMFRSLSQPFAQVLRGDYSILCKAVRALYAILARLWLDGALYRRLLNAGVSVRMSGYDTVCIVSEASKLRTSVAKLDGPRKIQWIHTDYAAWRGRSGWTRAITKNDGKLYRDFDVIVCLSERLKERFLGCHPHLRGKVVVIPNLIEYERILRMAEEKPDYLPDGSVMNLVSVGRMEQEKQYDSLLKMAAALKQRRVFHWYFVGEGNLLDELKAECGRMGLEGSVTFTGKLENPYPLMMHCDFLVLWSEYEGTPVTIDEAKVLGLPVIANDVGGVRDQLEGWEGSNVMILCSEDEIVRFLASMPCREKIQLTSQRRNSFDALNNNIHFLLKKMVL